MGLCLEGREGVPPDYPEAIKWFKKGATMVCLVKLRAPLRGAERVSPNYREGQAKKDLLLRGVR